MDARLHPDLASWLASTLGPPTPAQAKAVPLVLDGRSVLVSSPTGSGKTLAAFLGLLSDLARLDDAGRLDERIHVVYVSPLKALARDVAANLMAPLSGIGREARVRVALRTGDTPRSERERMARHPPHVLVTTPESLALVLGSTRHHPALQGARAVVVDEVHALMGTKRGAHLALTLERLDLTAGAPLQRVGLSATVRPLDEAARFLCGGRACEVVEAAPPRPPRLAVGRVGDAALVDRIEAVVRANRTTLVFTNTRQNAERLATRVRDRLEATEDEDATVAPHHGSMSRESRHDVETRLKASALRCVVASSSLELGIHVDDVDAVVLAGSPRSAARAVQRVGRSGHRVGGEPKGIVLVDDPDEVLEAIALAGLVRQGFLEPTRVPKGGSDVLAQHLLGLALAAPATVDDAWALACRAWPYRDLARGDVDALVTHLVDARLATRTGDAYVARGRYAKWAYSTSAGAIPDAALLRVTSEGRYIGEVEEAFAETLDEGHVFQLAGRSWRFLRVLGRTVEAAPMRADRGDAPPWGVEGIAASPELAAATCSAEPFLDDVSYDDDLTKEMAKRFLAAHRAFAGAPTPGEHLVETGLTPGGDRAVVLHAPLGRRATDALARVLAARCGEAVRATATDLGLALVGRRGWHPRPRDIASWLAEPLRDALVDALRDGELIRRRFRHVGERAFLLPRRDGTLRERQREATHALRRLEETRPDHPLLLEAWREVLEEALDLPTAEAWRAGVAAGRVTLRHLDERPCLSPLGATITLPRGAKARGETLRDAVDVCAHWKRTEERAPRARGG